MDDTSASRELDLVLPISAKVDSRTDDIERARRGLLTSLVRAGYPNFAGKLHVICPERDVQLIETQLLAGFPQFNVQITTDETIRDRIGFDEQSFSAVPPWFKQQLVKISVGADSKAQLILVLDADVIACQPIRANDLEPEQLAYQPVSLETFKGWFETSAAALDVDLSALEEDHIRHPMGVTPEFLYRSLLTDLVARLVQRAGGPNWGPYLMGFFRDYKNTWTEFSLYWIWYAYCRPDYVHHVPKGLYAFLEDPSKVRDGLILYPQTKFLVLQSTKLALSDCQPIYDALQNAGIDEQHRRQNSKARLRRTLWLIPGAHKTGTTLIQRILQSNPDRLAADGFQFVDRDAFYASRLRTYLSQGTISSTSVAEQDAVESLLELTEDDKALPSSIFFIENMFGEPLFGVWSEPRPTPALYPFFETRLKRFIAIANEYFNLKFGYFIRRQDDFVESYYVQCIHSGFDMAEADFLSLLIDCNMSWYRIISMMKSNIPDAEIRVFPFELLHAGKMSFVKHVLQNLGIDFSEKDWRSNVFENRSLSKAGIMVARAAFQQLEFSKRANFIHRLQQDFNNSTGERYQLFSDKFRNGLVNRYEKSNLDLLKAFGYVDANLLKYYNKAIAT